MARGAVENRPRYRLRLEHGALAVMAAVRPRARLRGREGVRRLPRTARASSCSLFRTSSPELVAVIDADKLGQLRTGAASGVAAKYLARAGAATLGVIGCGWQAESQVACIRAAVPGIERVVAYCRTEASVARVLRAHRRRAGREPPRCRGNATSSSPSPARPTPCCAASGCDPGALVCAVGANDGRRRELDNVVLERASFVCCDSLDDARLESADLIEPVEGGMLDWLEVHELQEVVAGETPGRQSDDDIVVFKSNGLAAWDVAVAARVVELAASACARYWRAASMSCSPSACTTSGRSSRRACCCGVSRFWT